MQASRYSHRISSEHFSTSHKSYVLVVAPYTAPIAVYYNDKRWLGGSKCISELSSCVFTAFCTTGEDRALTLADGSGKTRETEFTTVLADGIVQHD